jgi:hypothetical protein
MRLLGQKDLIVLWRCKCFYSFHRARRTLFFNAACACTNEGGSDLCAENGRIAGTTRPVFFVSRCMKRPVGWWWGIALGPVAADDEEPAADVSEHIGSQPGRGSPADEPAGENVRPAQQQLQHPTVT